MIKIINNVLTTEDCFSLYKGLVSSNMWNLSRQTSPENFGGSFPGVTFVEDQKIFYNDPYWTGYFNCLFDRINQKLKEQHNFSLPRVITRISLNAQNDNHYTQFHADYENAYSIVGFLTPQWAEDWGGELNIEGKVNKYNPGDFILFESTKLHKSQPIKKIPYWRLSINYVIEKK
tara:strand:- start:292 stop:816 length:525 start_codon:yes stop_codon:yes gene_type:complete